MIAELTPPCYAAYERFLADRPEAMIYASLAWRRLLEDYLEVEPLYLVALERGEISAALPAFIKRTPGVGAVINSLPFFGSNGGVLVAPGADAAGVALVYALDAAAERFGCVTATLIESPLMPDASLYGGVFGDTLRDRRIGQLTSLVPADADEGHLLARCEASARRNVNKARRLGVVVEEGDWDEGWDYLAVTHHANIEAMGGRTKPRRFFSLLRRHLAYGTQCRLFVARHNGEPIAALLLLYFNRTVEYFTPAISASARSSQPLSLLLCKAMTRAAAEGFGWWNWGGTWETQQGVYRFKRKWAAQDHPYTYYIKPYQGFDKVSSMSREVLMDAFPDFYVYPLGQSTTASQPGSSV
jgi:CelD/BcsL family acetyltransferase involved in cellulose biosynthesis